MIRTYQSGAQKRLAKRRKIADAATNSRRLSSLIIQPETTEHRDDLATTEQVTSVSCVSDDDKYTMQNLGHRTESISINFLQESCSSAREASVSLRNKGDE